MKVIVLGANGQLGLSFKEVKHKDRNWIFLGKNELDITDRKSLEDLFIREQPKIIINCAAYTAVDKAETDHATAQSINEIAPAKIAEYCTQNDCLLIHYSTDYVYHSQEITALVESEATMPKGVYAQTKLDGENAIIRSGASYFIIRTSWVYSPFKNNFVKTMIRLFGIKDELSIVNDQVGAPSYTFDIVEVTLRLIDKWNSEFIQGNQIFNYSNDGQISWFDFAVAIKDLIKSDIKLHAIPSEDYPTPAPRPKWSVMNLTKIKTELNLPLMPWQDSLVDCIARLDNIEE